MPAHLLRRFVCGRCGAPVPLSDRPYQECASCSVVGDYDHGVARQHVDWPGHEALFAQLYERNGNRLSTAFAARDRDGYASVYTQLLYQLIDRFPALYPSRAGDAAYRKALAAFHGNWQALAALEPALVHGDQAFRALRAAVVVKRGHASPATLWPLIERALQHYDELQRIADQLAVVPPDDFLPGYIRRFSISVTVAEWLPQLAPAAQRELVTRLGVSREYVEPAHDKIPCPNCGGTVEVAPGFLTMACPYCTAEIQEARADFRAIEQERYTGGGHDTALGAVEAFVKQKVQRLQILDGEVLRKGKPYRMITLRAGFADRAANFWRMFDAPASPKLAAALAWATELAARRKLPVDRFPYREHPRCTTLPQTTEDLARRLAESGGTSPYSIVDGDGSAIEVLVGDTIVRLVHDEAGKRTKLLRGWLGLSAG